MRYQFEIVKEDAVNAKLLNLCDDSLDNSPHMTLLTCFEQ